MSYTSVNKKMQLGRVMRRGGFSGFGALGDTPPSNACGTGTAPDPTTGASMNMATSSCECPSGMTWDGSSMTCVSAPAPVATGTPSGTVSGQTSAAPAAGSLSAMVAPVMNTLTLGGKIPDVVVYGAAAYAAYHFLFKKKRS